MSKQPITEAMGVHKDWYEARPKTADELAAFVTKLLTEYDHDYGTICHAAAAAAIAAVRTVDADRTQGGITGFQAGAIMWEFAKHWLHLEGPLRLVQYEDMLFPQKAEKFERTISLDTFGYLQKRANELLADGGMKLGGEVHPAHPEVLAHWKRIVDGEVPFGFQVKD